MHSEINHSTGTAQAITAPGVQFIPGEKVLRETYRLLFLTFRMRNSGWGLAAVFFEMPALSLAVSGLFVLLMSGMIIFETQNIVRGGETNYLLATVSLCVTICNLFASLLHIFGFLGGDDGQRWRAAEGVVGGIEEIDAGIGRLLDQWPAARVF